jgi:hypothetical protein
MSESGTDSFVGRAGPTRGASVVTREVRREIAADKGTDRASRPPLTGK